MALFQQYTQPGVYTTVVVEEAGISIFGDARIPVLIGEGQETRQFKNIRSEIEQAFDLHEAAGTRLGGVHLELTGENVTECLGGARQLTEVDLQRDYRTTVDPRLNYEQALEIAMLIVRKRGQLT